MNIRDIYHQVYDEIARRHVEHWRETGENPFQGRANYERNNRETIQLLLRHTVDGAILDAGCGLGDLLLALPDSFEGSGFDLSWEYVRVARNERGLGVWQATIEDIPWQNEAFDTVVCTDVLEHILDLNAAVRELLRVLRSGGVLVIRVPNEEDLTFYASGDCEFSYVHLRRFDIPTVQILFEKIFGITMLEAYVKDDLIHAAARK